MSAFIYGTVLQWKLDIRSKSLLITCYAVPLAFFLIMGGIFTSINPTAKDTLIQSMTIMGISMGASIGLPPSLAEVYGSDIKKMYKAGGIPLYQGLVSMFLSAFVHLFLMSTIIYLAAPVLFDAALPANLPLYLGSLCVFLLSSLSVGCALGLLVKNQAKLTMVSQLVFLPSIMLSGIMFPADMLPPVLKTAGKLFPAAWGNHAMTANSFDAGLYVPQAVIFLAAGIICTPALMKKARE